MEGKNDGKRERVTIHTVAAMAGVSAATVSRVVNNSNLVKPATRERVLSVLEEVGFQYPSRLARALRTQRSGLVGLLVTDILNPYYALLAREAEDATQELGMTLLLSNDDGDETVATSRLQVFGSLNVDGVIVSTWIGKGVKRDALLELRSRGIGVVGVSDQIDEDEFDTVAVDYRAAARDAVKHLLQIGHRRIGFVGFSRSAHRVLAYEEELNAAGLPAPILLLPSVVSPRRLRELMPALLPTFLKENAITAILAHNDVYALEVIRTAQSAGYRIPRDLSVIGFDNVPQGDTSTPPLFTYVPPYRDMLRTAVQLIRQRLEGEGEPSPYKRLFKAEPLPRESVGLAPNVSSEQS